MKLSHSQDLQTLLHLCRCPKRIQHRRVLQNIYDFLSDKPSNGALACRTIWMHAHQRLVRSRPTCDRQESLQEVRLLGFQYAILQDIITEEGHHSLSSASSSSPCANRVHHHTKSPAGVQLMVGVHLGMFSYTTSVDSGKRQTRSENNREYVQIQ
jgi:hypothetical protein